MSDPTRLEGPLRAIVPAATVLVGATCDLVSWTGGTVLLPSPWIALALTAYWSLERPDLVPPFVLLLVGLIFDLAGGAPPGLSALVLIPASLVLVAGRSEIRAQSAVVGWFAVALVLLGAMLVRWAVMVVWGGALFPVTPVLLDTASTIALYPLLATVMGSLRPWLPRLARVPA